MARSHPALAVLRRADPVLGRLINRVGPYALVVEPPTSVYEALAHSIVYQQLTAKAASTIFARVCALCGDSFPAPTQLLALPDDALRAAGLSGAKMAAVRDLARRCADGLLPDVTQAAAMTDDALVAALTSVRGIGPWSVQMFLMFRLGRPDVMPSTDYGVQKGFQRVFRTTSLPTPKIVAARGERWRPWRSVASWYLWRALELPARVAPPRRRVRS